MIIGLLFEFFTGENNLLCVDNDYAIAAINVRGVFGLMLTVKDGSSGNSNLTEGLACGVDYIPLAVHIFGFEHECGHEKIPPFLYYLFSCLAIIPRKNKMSIGFL
jgi:hypothetical protein